MSEAKKSDECLVQRRLVRSVGWTLSIRVSVLHHDRLASRRPSAAKVLDLRLA
jgi:hypothetical protein